MTTSASLSFDHTHVISPDPEATAAWYVDKFGGSVVKNAQVAGAQQIYVGFADGSMIIVRGERPGEKAAGKAALQWGIDHFGMRVRGDFERFCDELRGKGVKFTVEPRASNPTTRIAFIEAPDGVSVELLSRTD